MLNPDEALRAKREQIEAALGALGLDLREFNVNVPKDGPIHIITVSTVDPARLVEGPPPSDQDEVDVKFNKLMAEQQVHDTDAEFDEARQAAERLYKDLGGGS